MKGSQKANLLIFLIVAILAFCSSLTFASLTIHEDYNANKLLALDNDTFEPAEIDYVPTVIQKNDTPKTNSTNNTTKVIKTTVETTVEKVNGTTSSKKKYEDA